MKLFSPVQSLLLLILVGLAIGGWLYGIHWKRVASGDLFSNDELMMVRLQDQIETLSRTNGELQSKIRSLTGEPEEEPTPFPFPPSSQDLGPDPAPELPSRAQKIETH